MMTDTKDELKAIIEQYEYQLSQQKIEIEELKEDLQKLIGRVRQGLAEVDRAVAKTEPVEGGL